MKKLLIATASGALAVTALGIAPAQAHENSPSPSAATTNQQDTAQSDSNDAPGAPVNTVVPLEDDSSGVDTTPDARKAVVKPTASNSTAHGKTYGAWKNINANWDWTMPRGVPAAQGKNAQWPATPMTKVPGYPQAGNALYGPLPSGANPAYDVTLVSKVSAKGVPASKLSCTWTIKASPVVSIKNVPCANRSVQLKEGTYPLTLTVTDTVHRISKTVNSKITVKNTLMAITGDSYASGEGFPQIRDPRTNAILWDDAGCHRSRWGGFVRAAMNLENQSNRSNVTLVDVACSGAQIKLQPDNTGVAQSGGMLSPQKKWPGGDTSTGEYMPAQVDQLSTIAQGKKYDTTLLSIGGNDAGLSTVVSSCMVFDVIGTMMQDAWNDVYNNQVAWSSCAFAGQAISNINFASFHNSSMYCTYTPEDQRQGIAYASLLGSCTQFLHTRVPLYSVVNNNLNVLETNYGDLGKCLGGTSGCETQKLSEDGNTPAAEFTSAASVPVASKASVNQAMYPDLTQREDPKHKGKLEFCGVQQHWDTIPGLHFTLADGGNWTQPSDWRLDTTKIMQNELVSPMNMISNSWAYGTFYEGHKNETLQVKTANNYPNSIPHWYEDPGTIPVEADGLVKQLELNGSKYGWTPGFSLYNSSHTHGLCAIDGIADWTDDLTDAAAQEMFAAGTGTALHPNYLGQQQYALMMTSMTEKSAGAAPGAPKNSVVPVKVKKTSLSLTKSGSKKIKKSSKVKLKLKIGGVAKGQKVQVLVRNSSQKKQQVINVTVKGGSATVVLTKKMTKGKKKAWVTAVAQYQGNLTIGNSKSKTVKLTIK